MTQRVIMALTAVALCAFFGDGRLDASRAALLVWASGHALGEPRTLEGGPRLGDDMGSKDDAGERRGDVVVLGRAARRSLVEALRKRFARNLTALAPLMTGAAAAGVLNRQATVGIGKSVARDLGLRR